MTTDRKEKRGRSRPYSAAGWVGFEGKKIVLIKVMEKEGSVNCKIISCIVLL